MIPPFITILIPLYNGVEFLRESVASVFGQRGVTPTIWELLIGINGHPQNSAVYQQACFIVADLREALPHGAQFQVRVIDMYDLPTRGKVAALNAMVDKCMNPHSPYVALLDADDVWAPHKLATQIPYLFGAMRDGQVVRHAYDIVGTQCIYFGTGAGEKEGQSPPIPLGDLKSYDFFKGNPIINSSTIIRRQFAHWSPNDEGIEDYGLWLSLKKQRATFYNCPEKMVRHRLHPESAFNSAQGNNAAKVTGLLARHRGDRGDCGDRGYINRLKKMGWVQFMR